MKSLRKAIDILDYLCDVNRNVGITELSLRLNLPKSTVHRILKVLLDYSIVEQEQDTSRYRMGLHLLKYSNSLLRSFDLRQIAKPILKKVCYESKETTFLTVWRNNQGICLDSISSSRIANTHLFVEIGREMPFYCTASSKVILANYPIEDIKKIIKKKPLLKYTPNTITEPEKLMKHLLKIKNKGYAICDEELEEGIKAIAAPVKDIKGKTIASITVTGLSKRMSSDNMEKLIKIVTDSAQEMSNKLGYKEENILKNVSKIIL
jgi:DNA-binding IclR family transcriptional regulator